MYVILSTVYKLTCELTSVLMHCTVMYVHHSCPRNTSINVVELHKYKPLKNLKVYTVH